MHIGAAAQRNHVVTLIAVAAFAANRVCNYVVKTTAVILNLNFDVNGMTNNVAIIFYLLKTRNCQRYTKTINICSKTFRVTEVLLVTSTLTGLST